MTDVRTPLSRLWTIEDMAGPANVPVYQGRGRILTSSHDLGSRAPIHEQDPTRYGSFKTVGAIKAAEGLPTGSIEARLQFTASEFARLARRGCPLDVQVHIGECEDPRDFNGGWQKVVVWEGADFSSYGLGELGALEQGQDAIVNEAIDFDALDRYEVLPITFSELAAAEIIGEVVGVAICDSVQCGACGVPSEGCEHIFAITITQLGSPGLPSELIYSSDGGITIGETNITTLAVNEDPSGLACVGTYLVVISNDSDSLHYAPLADILNGLETWTEMATGFVGAGSPNAIWAIDSAHVWIVGDGGYVYFSDDITASVTPQSAGTVTAQNLNDVHAYNEDNVLAVGDSNAVIYTTNGGDTWASVTGPAVGVNLNCCWMHTEREWFVGDAGGNLWYTRDRGVNWTQKAFPGDGAGEVRDIVFPTPTVGYMAHSIAGPAGRILRTIDGGRSWYVAPEGTTTIPANDYVASLASVPECPNVVYGGGLADDGTDGFLTKAA